MSTIDRKELYSVEFILSIIRSGVESVVLDGDTIRLTSLKYALFLEKGVECVSCSLVGMFFAKERDEGDKRDSFNSYYLSLYGLTPEGEEVLITKDHVQPRSRGGEDAVSNMQTMCVICNHRKGNKFTRDDYQYLK